MADNTPLLGDMENAAASRDNTYSRNQSIDAIGQYTLEEQIEIKKNRRNCTLFAIILALGGAAYFTLKSMENTTHSGPPLDDDTPLQDDDTSSFSRPASGSSDSGSSSGSGMDDDTPDSLDAAGIAIVIGSCVGFIALLVCCLVCVEKYKLKRENQLRDTRRPSAISSTPPPNGPATQDHRETAKTSHAIEEPSGPDHEPSPSCLFYC